MPEWPKVKHTLHRRQVPLAREYLEVVGVVAVLTVLESLVPNHYRAFGYVNLLGVIALSLRVGRGPVLAAAVLSAFSWYYCAIPPRMTFQISDADDVVLLVAYIVVALLAGQLTAQIRAQGAILGAAAEREKMLTESDRLHRTLFDSISHELKTPLTVLRSAVWALKKRTEGPDGALVGEIGEATDRLNRLVGNLLDQSRLESGTIAPKLDWCDVRDLIQEARHEVEYALSGRMLTVEIADNTPLLRADSRLTERAVANLILNAAVHTPAGSSIAVRSGVEGERIFIAVADRGPGVPAEIQGNLFQKFPRGSASRAGGLGLGLSIVHGFVAAQGGEVAFSEEPAGGSRFTVYFPVTPFRDPSAA